MAKVCLNGADELEAIASVLDGQLATRLMEQANNMRIAGDHLHAYVIQGESQREDYERIKAIVHGWQRS